MMRRCVPVFAVLVLLLGLGTEALAQSKKALAESLGPQARPLYDTGVSLYRKADYAGALAQFAAAYKVEPDARLLWNMAACEKDLGHHAAAHGLVRRYLDEAQSSISEKDRRDAAR